MKVKDVGFLDSNGCWFIQLNLGMVKDYKPCVGVHERLYNSSIEVPAEFEVRYRRSND